MTQSLHAFSFGLYHSAVILFLYKIYQDKKLAQQFMLGIAYGLGGFWSTPKLIYTQEMNAFLGLNEKDKCLGLFYIGYPAIEWPKAHRRPLDYTTEWHL